FKRVVSSAEKARRRQLTNVTCAHFNAKYLDHIFAPSELEGAFIFFPDPWTKPSHNKHRLLNPGFIKTLAQVIQPGGFVWLKTDQRPYFEESQRLFAESGFEPATTLELCQPLLKI